MSHVPPTDGVHVNVVVLVRIGVVVVLVLVVVIIVVVVAVIIVVDVLGGDLVRMEIYFWSLKSIFCALLILPSCRWPWPPRRQQ